VIVFGAMLLWGFCATMLDGPTSIIGRNYRFVIPDVKNLSAENSEGVCPSVPWYLGGEISAGRD